MCIRDSINIDMANTNIPNGMEMDSEKECERYNHVIEKVGGIDMQLLGLGHNGHIGFNEPGEVFEKMTHCVNLTESTIEANKRFFASADDVPRQAYTMGIKTIMQAKKILLVVSLSLIHILALRRRERQIPCLSGPVLPGISFVMWIHIIRMNSCPEKKRINTCR